MIDQFLVATLGKVEKQAVKTDRILAKMACLVVVFIPIAAGTGALPWISLDQNDATHYCLTPASHLWGVLCALPVLHIRSCR
jgi:hypothetical protein